MFLMKFVPPTESVTRFEKEGKSVSRTENTEASTSFT